MKIKLILGASILLLVSVQVNASIVTIDFESLRVETDQSVISHGTSYTEDGFTLSVTCCEPAAGPQDTSLRTTGTLAVEYPGSTAMRGGTSNALITLTENEGDLFDLLSIDLAAFPGTTIVDGVLVPVDTGIPQVVTFEGIKFGGGTVTQTFEHMDFLNLTTYSLIGFNQLSLVSWFQGAGDPNTHQFDNISVQLSVIPIPAAVWLFGTAMIGLVGFGRRRKQAEV